MRRLVYFTCFLPVALASLALIVLNLAYLAGAQVPLGVASNVMALSKDLASPTPSLLRTSIPPMVHLVLQLLLWSLVLRRLWLIVRRKNTVAPTTLEGPLYWMACIAAASLWLGVVAIGVTVAARVNSGVGAGLVILPGVLLTGVTIFLVELTSLVKARRGRSEHSSPNAA